MPRRFTLTEKWGKAWFRRLNPITKLLIFYLYDNCDIAGFWDIDHDHAAFEIGVNPEHVEVGLREIEETYLTDGKQLWLKEFIFDQGNWPLKSGARAHKSIMEKINRSPLGGRVAEYLNSSKEQTLFGELPNSPSLSNSLSISKRTHKADVKLCKSCGKSLYLGRNGKDHCSGRCEQ